MPKSLLLLSTLLASSFCFAETPCRDVGTPRDPELIAIQQQNVESRARQAAGLPRVDTSDESVASMRRQLADAQRCNHRDNINLLQNVLAFEDNPVRPARPAPIRRVAERPAPIVAEAISPVQTSVVRQLKIQCEYGKRRPFEIIYLDGNEYSDGRVVALGYHDNMSIELTFNNRRPSEGRTLVTTIGNNSFTKSLSGDLSAIEYSSGLISRMAGVQGDYKVKCFPLRQQTVTQPPRINAEPQFDNSDRSEIDKPSGSNTNIIQPPTNNQQ